MNENAKQWVEALRSGKYSQARAHLRDAGTNNFCCLGVACDLSGLGEWVDRDNEYNDAAYVVSDLDQDWAGLPDAVRKHFGVVDTMCLSGLNDNGKSFEEIADFIVANEKQMFA